MPRFSSEQYEVLKEFYEKDPDWSPKTIGAVWKVFLEKFGKEYVETSLSKGKVYKWGYDNKARNLRKKFSQYNMDTHAKFSTKVCLRKPITFEDVKDGAIVDFNKEVTNLLAMVDRPISSALHELDSKDDDSENSSTSPKTDSTSDQEEAPKTVKPKLFRPIPRFKKLEDSSGPYQSLGSFLSSFVGDSGMSDLDRQTGKRTGYIMIVRDLRTGKVMVPYQIPSFHQSQ